jgi:hypothetical protein
MVRPSMWIARAFAAGALAAAGGTAAHAADTVLKDGTIGYVITDLHWKAYVTPDAQYECGGDIYQWGPREQFKVLYPDDGTKRNAQDTHLAFEIGIWFPDTSPDKFPYSEIKGNIAYGMNLDGKIGPNDFVTPSGEPGIDNQLWRSIGCNENYRPPDGSTQDYANKSLRTTRYSRLMLELTGVSSLENDDDVTVTMYRGLDNLLTDATGSKILPGGTMRVDAKWGEKVVRTFKGKIVNGTLITVPATDVTIPWATDTLPPTVTRFRDMRMQLELRPDVAIGYFGGYVDLEAWYWETMKAESTHHQSNGRTTLSSLYKILRKNADAYPDPKTGENMALSSALGAQFVQTFIVHPPKSKPVAAAPSATGAGSVQAARQR